MARQWALALSSMSPAPNFETRLFLYRNAHRNNGPLPERAWRHNDLSAPLPVEFGAPQEGSGVPFSEIFETHTMIMAPTELSATAPLKLAARRHGFRAATMPGFRAEMIPALNIDYGEVNRHVLKFKALLDQATAASFRFVVTSGAGRSEYQLQLDLRHRVAHASGGILANPGDAGNLPSGEAYIVPYEGEIAGDESLSAGELPVEFSDGLVVYEIKANKVVRVTGESPAAEREARHLEREPAYGNIAELGLGVLAGFGVAPVGETLLDEKLGLHIAFGRSDHFGGQVGVADFSEPGEAIHIDRVYIPEIQPRIEVAEVSLRLAPEPGSGTRESLALPIIENDRYV